VPLMGVLVIPAAVLALCLWPLGLDWIGLWAMGLGLDWTLGVAHFVAGLDGARGFVPQPGPVVLPLIALGFLFVILWQGRLRILGLAPALLGFMLWSHADRPAVLIDANGGLVGVMTEQGRALSKPRGAGFVARVWLENDGDGVDQSAAAARWRAGEKPLRRARLPEGELVHVIGKRAAAQFTECRRGQIIISQAALKLSGPCDVYDPERLRRTGSLAIDKGIIRTARETTGARLWNLSGGF